MLVVETIAKIRRAHFILGKSIKQICREVGVSRNTVRKVVRLCHSRMPFVRAHGLLVLSLADGLTDLSRLDELAF